MIFPQQTRIALPNLVAYSLARSSQGGLLSVSSIFQTRMLWQVLAHQGKEITALAWSHDGDLLASSGEDDMIRVWQGATGQCLSTIEQDSVDRLQWSSSGTLAASCGGVIHLLPQASICFQAAAA